MTEAERDRAGELGSLSDLIVDAKRGLTAIPDVTVTDDERRFIAWARYYHGGVEAFVDKYDRAQTLVTAARALVERWDALSPYRQAELRWALFDRADTLAREVHALEGEQ